MATTRIGHGFDLHRLEPGHDLIVGGVKLDHDQGCVAHSDGDVLYHAVTDAVLGALGQDDIGQLFPDNDPAWDGADSAIFVREAFIRMRAEGYMIGNIDCTVILQRPKLGPHKNAIKAKLAELLGCEISQVNLKAKTHEEVDALGEGRAIACHVVVLLSRFALSYSDWCGLTEEQQVNRIQNMVGGFDDSPLINAACAELKQTDSNIVRCSPGNFHGDEWIIHAYVYKDELPQYEELSQIARFRGFRIFYIEAN